MNVKHFINNYITNMLKLISGQIFTYNKPLFMLYQPYCMVAKGKIEVIESSRAITNLPNYLVWSIPLQGNTTN
jgi:hypothetical protein